MLQCRPICRVTEEAAKNVLDQLLKKFKGPKAMQLFGVFSSLQTYTQQELLKLMNRNETIRNNIKLLTSISVAPNTTDRILQDITKKIEENICL